MVSRNITFRHIHKDLSGYPIHNIPGGILIQSLIQRSLTAEKLYPAGQFFRPPAERFLFIVQHTEILFCLILCNIKLSIPVIFHRSMAVQMIRCNIQYGADCRPECIYRLQLEAADLRHSYRLL